MLKLFSASENISGRKFNSSLLKDLPKPVQKYFNFSLSENIPFISYIRLKHGGRFKPQNKWMKIKGEEYFTTENPGFIWYGKVPLISARDLYYNGEGNLIVKLLHFIKIVDEKGPEINQGEMLRWLAEAPLFPTALLPSDKISWEAIDDFSAKVVFTYKNMQVEGNFHFAESGEIKRFTAKRFYNKTLENWTGYYNEYKTIEGVKIPFHLEVEWNLESEDLQYVDFTINEIEFNNPTPF